jgi:nicotinamide-nucleotide amidase
MIAEIITIGDEILIGQIVDSNSAWIAEELNLIGVKIGRIVSISDDAEEIKHALDSGFERADLLIVTGGLGPTKDDITKTTLADYFNDELILSEDVLAHVTALFARFGREMTDLNRRQALVPSKCIPLKNPLGTAPGMWFDQNGKAVVSLPGVPYEMKGLMEHEVSPLIQQKYLLPAIVHKTVLTHGLGESWLSEQIAEWEDALPKHIKLAYLPSPGRVRLRLSATGDNAKTLLTEVESQIEELKKLIPHLIYGYDDDTMEQEVGKLLKELNATLSTAESCTGGGIAASITSVSGSSEYFLGSTVSYANQVKQEILGVSSDMLTNQGAVSVEVVKQMAEGSRKLMHSDYAVSTSGIAGPGGGSEEKPVGTVWIGLSGPNRTIAKKFLFGDVRKRNIQRSIATALNMLRKELLKDLEN